MTMEPKVLEPRVGSEAGHGLYMTLQNDMAEGKGTVSALSQDELPVSKWVLKALLPHRDRVKHGHRPNKPDPRCKHNTVS